MGLAPGLALPAFHRGLHPAGFPPVPGGIFAPPMELGAGPPVVAPVPAPTSNLNSVASRWFHGPAGINEWHMFVVNPGEFLEFLVYDQAGTPSATSIIQMTRRWPGNATGWFAEVQYVGCSDSLFSQLVAQSLPPTGTGVLHVCSSVPSLCCTWLSWPEREVIHSDTVRRRSAASMTEVWVPPSVVASAVLQLAQEQGRAAHLVPPQRDPPGPEFSGVMGQAPAGAE